MSWRKFREYGPLFHSGGLTPLEKGRSLEDAARVADHDPSPEFLDDLHAVQGPVALIGIAIIVVAGLIYHFFIGG